MAYESEDAMQPYRPIIIVGIIIVLLQVAIFPQFHLFSFRPDLFLVLTATIGFAYGSRAGVIAGFICGLCYDLLGVDTVGTMALLSAVAGFASGFMQRNLFLENYSTPTIFFVGIVLAVEILYSLLLIVLGADISIGNAIIYRVIPSSITTILIGFITFYILSEKVWDNAFKRPSGLKMMSHKKVNKGSGVNLGHRFK